MEFNIYQITRNEKSGFYELADRDAVDHAMDYEDAIIKIGFALEPCTVCALYAVNGKQEDLLQFYHLNAVTGSIIKGASVEQFNWELAKIRSDLKGIRSMPAIGEICDIKGTLMTRVSAYKGLPVYATEEDAQKVDVGDTEMEQDWFYYVWCVLEKPFKEFEPDNKNIVKVYGFNRIGYLVRLDLEAFNNDDNKPCYMLRRLSIFKDESIIIGV